MIDVASLGFLETLFVSDIFVFIKPYRLVVKSFQTLYIAHKYFSYPYITKQLKDIDKSAAFACQATFGKGGSTKLKAFEYTDRLTLVPFLRFT